MATSLRVAVPDGIAEFKLGVDALINRRSYFISRVLPMLAEGADFYIIKGKRSLSKGGAEKLSSIYGLTATFHKDTETLEAFGKTEGVVAYVCTLKRGESITGQGRGAAVAKSNGGDINKTIKMAQKSAFIDAVIRSTGLSDIFTQDLETMPESAIRASTAVVDTSSEDLSNADDPHYPFEPAASTDENDAEPITDRQRDYLCALAQQNLDEGERESYIASLDQFSKADASEAIKGMLAMAGR